MRRAVSRARVIGVVSVLGVVVATMLALGAPAFAASASDPTRATFVGGNAVNCAQIGFPGSTLAFADGNDSIADGNVSGDVVPNTSSIQSGTGEMVNVNLPSNGAVIDAVVVKGGPAYNVYSTSSGAPAANHVPPAEAAPTEYIAPLNGGGKVPAVSHWFICYRDAEEPPETGSLLVTKVVIPPVVAGPVVPTVFSITVVCSDGTNETFLLPFDQDGIPTFARVISPIVAGSTCTVSEDQTGFPPLTIVVIDQPDPIPAGGQSEATVTNAFGSVGGGVVTAPTDPPAAAAITASPRLTG